MTGLQDSKYKDTMNQFIKDMVENPHPVFQRNIRYWNFLLESYEGGADYTQAFIKDDSKTSGGVISVKVNGKALRSNNNSNLFAHPKEREEDYKKRIDMSYYYNFCAPVIETYTNHLFKQDVNVDFANIEKIVRERENNIDRKGSSINEYRKQVAESMQIFGHTFTLVDSPTSDLTILNLKDKMDAGMFPYFVNIQPQNVLNWALDKFGNAYWVLVMEQEDANSDPLMFDKNKRTSRNFRLWTREEWILFSSDYEEIERGIHGLGVVPISCAYDRKSKKEEAFLGISFIADISFIARDIYNSCSELKQILRDQTFSILAIQGDARDYPSIEVATNKGLLVPKDSHMPQYITPPPGPADTLMRHIDAQVSKIFQMAKLEGGSASFSGQTAVQQSGVSKAWDFNQTNSALTSKSTSMEDAELRAWQMFAKWEGTEFDGTIEYPDEFSVNDLKKDLDDAEQMIRMDISKTFAKELKREIVKKKFPRLEEATETEIEKEIESFTASSGGRIAERLSGFINNTPTGGNNGGFTNGRN